MLTSPTMFCLDCRYALDHLREHRCPECGRLFDPLDMTTYGQDAGDLVRLRVSAVAVTLHLYRQRLAEDQIPSAVMSDGLAGSAGIGVNMGALPALWVGRRHAERAERIIAEFEALPDQAQGDAWTCADCGELIEPQFSECWNCGSEKK